MVSLPMPAGPIKRMFLLPGRESILIKASYSFKWPIITPIFNFSAKPVKSTLKLSKLGVGLEVRVLLT